ncbi:(S)-2-hydroxy-acid oxidase [Thermodesulfobium narugense DSM 14796]|uniref:(S)-2-hydroxy-acid oxidase n=1 Tax=Thermodesulfobium narugense DSM 14796 TaxID=747365 RepID=M1E5R9_9BACT|nr:alpha-hydroxy-acid oxidizing protein [Thermodesulfobium narugense]AEE15242.1 (S)-2-hydroxy-acid oxidase [Thermodesulfobium narugense DSM 14796]
MDLKTIKEEARKKFNNFCRVCVVCDGRACAGEVPGMGGTGTGESFKQNVRALSDIRLNLRVVHDVLEPDTSINLFGINLLTPIMGAPITNASLNCGGGLTEFELVSSLVKGCHDAGSLGWIGDPAIPSMFTDGLEAIKLATRGVAIIKPRVDQGEIIRRFEDAIQAGAIAVGIDIDGAGLVTMKLKGQAVGPKNISKIRELVNSVSVPFVVKGIMTPDEAVACFDAGANAIVVSNHGGRVLDFTPGVAEVLPKIIKAVGKDAIVLADGGVRSGVDALKLIALGAKGVLVGRPLITGAFGAMSEGVKFIIEKYTQELYAAMILTGCKSIKDIDSRIIFEK